MVSIFLSEVSIDIFNETHKTSSSVIKFHVKEVTIDGMVATWVTGLEFKTLRTVMRDIIFDNSF
jgi:hypothetical protein